VLTCTFLTSWSKVTQVRAPGRAAKYRLRAAQLRKWVEQKSPAAGFIDFDSLSLAPNGPPNTKSDKCALPTPHAADKEYLRSSLAEMPSSCLTSRVPNQT
jgi:hypothetical protein